MQLTNVGVNIAGSTSVQVLLGVTGNKDDGAQIIRLNIMPGNANAQILLGGPQVNGIYVIMALNPRGEYVTYYDYRCVMALPAPNLGPPSWEFWKP